MARLAHLAVGAGPRPVVLLHGYLGSGRNLVGLARRWADADPTRMFVLPDLTGHGSSPPLAPRADVSSLADDVRETLAALGVARAEWAGHSLGGRVALAAALRHPDEVEALTLLDIGPAPFAVVGAEPVARLFAHAPALAARREDVRHFFLERGLAPALAEWLLTNLVHGPDGYRWRVDREALLRLAPAIGADDLWPAVERPGARVRCARGERSEYVSDEDVRRLERAGAVVETLAGAGHFVHVDRPAELLRFLLETGGK